MTRWPTALVALAIFGPGATAAPTSQSHEPRGFVTTRTEQHEALEAKFDAAIDADQIRAWMAHLSSRPHHVGSPFGKEVAEFLASRFTEWGFDTRIEEFQVLFPTPRRRRLELIAPTRFTAALEEPILTEDTSSAQRAEQLPSYNAYSIDGNVSGELVYVNYGVPADYEALDRHGIDVRGKVVIARYGGSWRGIKPKVAAERGAIGCLIYSDPFDDGYAQGDVYPNGPYRMDRGIQRGSVADMPLFPGDPLTPGVGATTDAPRLDRSAAPTLTTIPVLPISYADALPLLRGLGGPVAPADWRGSLPLTYHIGPGPSTVELELKFDWNLTPIYNVLATLEGRERPEQLVIRGNHHDAWVNGARDPISGLVALMAEARAVSALARTGWRPKRTLVFAAWDAEEPGLLGSTEWVEQHADRLRSQAVAYINTDGNSRGFLGMSGSHTLERFINEVAHDVPDPQTGVSVSARLAARRRVNTASPQFQANGDHPIGALGSGSDYTPFLQHLGVASLNLSYSGESGGGSYHSIYDSFDHYTRFGDPDFAYSVALAQTAGRALLRLAEADVLPFEFENFSETVKRYVHEIVSLTDEMRAQTQYTNQLLAAGDYNLAADPTKTYVSPTLLDPVPHLNFAPLHNALTKLTINAKAYGAASAPQTLERLSVGDQRAVDGVLIGTERALTRSEGLPGRPWFKHQVYAPGFYTGYGVKTIPGVREAIEQRDWTLATTQIALAAGTLVDLADQIGKATAILQSTR